MKPRRPQFLARQGYRLRRVMDAARALPILGAFLFLIPLLWSNEQGGQAATHVGTVYLFLIWAWLIMIAAWLSWRLSRAENETSETMFEEPQE